MTVTTQMLIDAGFAPVAGAEGSLGKCMKAGDMPYLSEHVVDDVNLGAEDIAVLIVDANRVLHFSVHERGATIHATELTALYTEDPVSIDTDDGKGTLRDAGVKLTI